VAVYPGDEAFTPIWQELSGQRPQRRFALPPNDAQADVRAVVVSWQAGAWQFTLKTPEGTAPVRLHIAGRHNVKNALAASACVLAAGVPLTAVAQGLVAFEPVKGRSRALVVHGTVGDITVVDDTYNANPDSVRAAIDVLAELPAPRLLVLGDMGEVGNQGPEFHAEVGRYAAECGIEALFTLGELCVHAAQSFGDARHFQDMDSLLDSVTTQVGQYRSVVVKGSRFMKMERVVQALQSLGTAGSNTDNKKGGPHAA
jgi:UDP-N-acetylmuramoyl-tripeptide--D-alanyl-D-alanine ligase